MNRFPEWTRPPRAPSSRYFTNCAAKARPCWSCIMICRRHASISTCCFCSTCASLPLARQKKSLLTTCCKKLTADGSRFFRRLPIHLDNVAAFPACHESKRQSNFAPGRSDVCIHCTCRSCTHWRNQRQQPRRTSVPIFHLP